MENKKKIWFTIGNIYGGIKDDITCCVGSCQEPHTKRMTLDVGNIVLIVYLCDYHARYISDMRLL